MQDIYLTSFRKGDTMNTDKNLKIFMLPQEFPCGEQSSCCGPIGQSEEQIRSLKSSIEKELGCEAEVLNVKNGDDMKNHPQVMQLVHSMGPTALPILTLEDEVVSMGNATAEKALVAIKEKIKKENFGKENGMAENDNTDEAGQQTSVDAQACCSTASGSGDCCSPDSGSGGKRWKMLVFLIIVVAAGAVLARSFIRKSNSTTDQKQQLFATIQPDVKSDTPSSPNVETPDKSKAGTDSLATVKSTTKAPVSGVPEPTLWGKPLNSLASLNKVAVNIDAVFILLAAQDQQDMQPVTNEIEAAARKIQSNGTRISAFTLQKNAPNYVQLAKQFPTPCVLAMVKGRGMSGVTGEITETKLLQAFVAASRPTSGCCPPGAGSSACGPLRSK